MKIQVVGIRERGIPNRERLALSVLQETNLCYYAALLSKYLSPASISTGSLPGYWFPNQIVKVGDQIELFSGNGSPRVSPTIIGGTYYSYYWGLPNVVWHDPSACAIVLELSNWATSPQFG
jgi:hypothetical protein